MNIQIFSLRNITESVLRGGHQVIETIVMRMMGTARRTMGIFLIIGEMRGLPMPKVNLLLHIGV
jgi:hypothetical protein